MPAPSADSVSPINYEEPKSPQTILNSQAPLSALKMIQHKTRNDLGALPNTKSAKTCLNQKSLPKLYNPIVTIDLLQDKVEMRKTVANDNNKF